MLVSQGNYVAVEGDIMDEDNITEQAGYIPAKIQVERLIIAGKRLDEYKKEMYDFSPEDKVGDPEVIKVRDPNYDLADGFKDNEDVQGRLREQEKNKVDFDKEKEKKASEEKAQAAEKAKKEALAKDKKTE